mmetsp:Transcript_13838/g.28065  ORF Transcript_13838/g.28065 Transcript_13838/m.28065 type:complete len:321 (-) Transcript_13838:164-1126(-)
MRIACIGDSLTRGDGSHEGRRQHPNRGNYPKRLQQFLDASHYTVRNFGHGGATACNASTMPYELTREFRRARAFRPHIVVLMLGTNDAKKHWFGPCAPGADHLISGLTRIAGALKPHGAKCSPINAYDCPAAALLLISPPPVLRERWGISRALLTPVTEAIRTHGKNLVSRQVAEAIRVQREYQLGNMTAPLALVGWPSPCRLGSTHLVPQLPFWRQKLADAESSFAEDGVHLNRRGSHRLAVAVHNALRTFGCLNTEMRILMGALDRAFSVGHPIDVNITSNHCHSKLDCAWRLSRAVVSAGDAAGVNSSSDQRASPPS